jgi:hypothetical protein
LRIDGEQPGSVFGSQQRGRPDGLWVVLRRRPDSECAASSSLGVAQRIWCESYPSDRISQVQQKESDAHLSVVTDRHIGASA